MKRSNILITSVAILTISWILLNGWLQANAFKTITSGQSCSYAGLSVSDNIIQIQSFQNIKIDFGKKSISPVMYIQCKKKQELLCSNNLKKAISYNVSGDTLYLRINYASKKQDVFFNIGVPYLKSVTMASASDVREDSRYSNNGILTIMGFKANTLSINNNSQFGVFLFKNKLNKLELKGDFRNNGSVEIEGYSDYDSLDVDIQGRQGTLILTPNSQIKENPKQWISIKAPASFRVEAEAMVASKITLKK